jgi:hypothetical protein
MADLLECLIQIKALRHTLTRVETAGLSASGPVSTERGSVTLDSVWQRMADAERRFAAALDTAGAGIGSSGEAAGDTRRVFVALRLSNLARLDGCTAAQLGGSVEWPGRPAMTVADLVAIMLAHDTEALGDLRGARPGDRSRRPRRGRAEGRSAKAGESRLP